MKKLLLLSFLLISNTVLADFPVVDIRNFSGDYSEPSGTAFAETFVLEDLDLGKDVNFKLEKEGGDFVAYTDFERIPLDFLPESVHELRNLEFKGIGFRTTDRAVNISVESLIGDTADQAIFVKELEGACGSEIRLEGEVSEQALEACLNHTSSLRLAEVATTKSKVKAIQFKVDKSKMNFSLTYDGKRINGYGETHYDAQAGLVRIKLNKVKYSFINITSRVFKELYKLENDQVTVNRPWITIDLNK